MEKITIEIVVNKPLSAVWEGWTSPNAITKWNFASDDWCCPWAKNDLKVGGKFLARMESVADKNVGFDFGGEYTEVEAEKKIAYFMGDNRKVEVHFEKIDDTTTKVVESFDAESLNSAERQKEGWQAILVNFKKYCESTK